MYSQRDGAGKEEASNALAERAELSSDRLYLAWIGRCQRVAMFIAPHGEWGLEMGCGKLNEIIEALKVKEKAVSHISLTYLSHIVVVFRTYP